MERNGEEPKLDRCISVEILTSIVKNQRIADAAVHKAQEENRRLGLPNWYSIDGKIVDGNKLPATAPKK